MLLIWMTISEHDTGGIQLQHQMKACALKRARGNLSCILQSATFFRTLRRSLEQRRPIFQLDNHAPLVRSHH